MEEEDLFTSLPDDNFGVYVENERDERKLLWLVNQIGEEKLRKSASKRSKYYPDSLLFVSTILKRFHLTVPPSVYTEVRVPIYWVYLLALHDHTAVKLGMTGIWPNRAYDFVKTANYALNFDEELKALFDLSRSIAFPARSRPIALEIEAKLKKDFANYKVPSPYERGLVNYGVGGHKEWFDFSIYDDLFQRLSSLGQPYSLGSAIEGV